MSLTNRLISIESSVPNENFNIVLYTGTNASHSITGVGFQPDLVWIKDRNNAEQHILNDSTRGATKDLSTDRSNAEATRTAGFLSFDSDGFTLGTDPGGVVNDTVRGPYVAWCWKANGGTTSSNTDGSVTSTVQANSNLGFSIVKYTGTGGNATIGHGLGTTPEMMIIKNLDQADDWVVYHSTLGTADWVSLNADSAASGTGTIFGTPNDVGVAPTSTVFTVGSNHKSGASGEDYIAYCFNSVSSYSKFGSYTGTAGALTVTTGFQPDFLMVKNTSTAGYSWYILDSVRGGSGGYINRFLAAESSQAETEVTNGDIDVTFTSTGFQYASTMSSTDGFNKSGDTYIYMAFKIN